MRKIFIVTLVILFSMSFKSVGAKDYRDEEVLSFIEDLKPVVNEWSNVKMKKGDILYGENHSEIGYLYRLFDGSEQKGYIIYLDGIGISEATWEGTDRASEIKGNVYYIIPGRFVSKKEFEEYENEVLTENKVGIVGSSIYDIVSYNPDTNMLSYIENNSFTLDVTKIPNLTSNVDSVQGYYSLRTTIQNVPDYTWREGCAPTAAANMIAYFDNNVWDYLTGFDALGSFSYTSPGNTYSNNLIDDLADRFDTDALGGTDVLFMGEQIEQFFSDANLGGYSVLMGVFDDTQMPNPFDEENINDYELLIDRGNPVVITLFGHPTYSEHAVTGIGYINSMNSNGVIIHDTWDNTPREVYLTYELVDFYHFIYYN